MIEPAQGPIAELASGETRLTLGSNELAQDARITWRGTPLTLSNTRPTKEELLGDDDASTRRAGYLIGRLTSRVRSRFCDGVAELHLMFDH